MAVRPAGVHAGISATADAIRSIRSVAAWNIIESTSHGLTCSILSVRKQFVSMLSSCFLPFIWPDKVRFLFLSLSTNFPTSELTHKHARVSHTHSITKNTYHIHTTYVLPHTHIHTHATQKHACSQSS